MKVIIAGAVLLVVVAGAYFGFRNFSPKQIDTSTIPTLSGSTSSDPTVFADDSLGFSFAIPQGFRAQKTLDDEGETVLVQSADASHGFEVYISAFTDPAESITRERIEKEAGLTVTNDSPLTVSTVGQGIQFDSTTENPPMRHAWFVYNGYLYQAHARIDDASVLQTMLASWKFTTHE
jgi:hypothetical protein